MIHFVLTRAKLSRAIRIFRTTALILLTLRTRLYHEWIVLLILSFFKLKCFEIIWLWVWLFMNLLALGLLRNKNPFLSLSNPNFWCRDSWFSVWLSSVKTAGILSFVLLYPKINNNLLIRVTLLLQPGHRGIGLIIRPNWLPSLIFFNWNFKLGLHKERRS